MFHFLCAFAHGLIQSNTLSEFKQVFVAMAQSLEIYFGDRQGFNKNVTYHLPVIDAGGFNNFVTGLEVHLCHNMQSSVFLLQKPVR